MTETQRRMRLERLKRRAVVMGVARDLDPDDTEEAPVERVPRDAAIISAGSSMDPDVEPPGLGW